MPPKRKAERKLPGPNNARIRTGGAGSDGGTTKAGNDLPAIAGYLISCDVPTKQYIQHLNDLKTQDKKFILEDLDAEHLLIKTKARAEIDKKVEQWMDAVSEKPSGGKQLYASPLLFCDLTSFFFLQNVFSAIERVGENLDMS